MSELRSYYERLLSVVQNDADALLSNPDPTVRPPKVILELLKAGQACEEALKASDESSAMWEKLSTATRAKIDALIKEDLGL